MVPGVVPGMVPETRGKEEVERFVEWFGGGGYLLDYCFDLGVVSQFKSVVEPTSKAESVLETSAIAQL